MARACRDGNFVRELSYLPLALDIPVAFNSCRKGPRGLEWRSDKPAELAWMEAQVLAVSRKEVPQMACGTWLQSIMHMPPVMQDWALRWQLNTLLAPMIG